MKLDTSIIVYKALIVQNGKLTSTIAGRGLAGYPAQDKPSLTYKEGEITCAPKGTKGIYTWATLEDAIRHLSVSMAGFTGSKIVHKATPLGQISVVNKQTLLFSAILLGKEVWRSSPIVKM